MSRVVIYTTDHCPYCVRAKQLLDRKSVVYEEVRVDINAEKRDEMIARSNRRSVPQIFIGDYHVGGCDDLYELNRQGKLDALLEK